MKEFRQLIAIVFFVFCFSLCASIFGASPKLILYSPIENTVTGKSKVLVKGQVENAVKLYLNNAPIKFDKKGKFYIKKDLLNPNKYNYFVLMAESVDGETTKVSRKVFFKKGSDLNTDSTVFLKPMIILSEPQDGFISLNPNVKVSGTLRESSDLKINGVTINVTDQGDFSFLYPITKKNAYETLSFVAKSPDGKQETAVERKVFYKDKTSEEFSIILSFPENDYVSRDPMVTFTGVVTGAQRFMINNKQVFLKDGGRFSHRVQLLDRNAYNKFRLVAINPLGKKIEKSRDIYYKFDQSRILTYLDSSEKAAVMPIGSTENVIPEIEIETPQDNYVTYKNKIDIKGRVFHAKELLINNRVIKLNNKGEFSETFNLDNIGKYVFNVYALGDNGLNAMSLLKLFRIQESSEINSEETKLSKGMSEKLSRLVSINLAGADLRDILTVLAQKGDLNLVTDKSLKGEIYISLQDVKIIDAIDFVLSSQGFSYRIVGTTIMVGDQSALDKPSRLETKIIRVNNIASSLLKPIIEEYLVQGESVQVRDNYIIITVDAKKVDSISSMVLKLDSDKIPQIMLEAQILEVNKSSLDNLGVSWPENYGLGITATDANGTISYAATYTLGTAISMLESKGKARVIAKPRIKAIHGQEAEIFIGDRIPYVELTVGAAGAVAESVSYVDAGINLRILPEINSHTQDIKIRIQPEVSYINGFRGKNNDIPIVRTRRVDTTVYVKNNNTVLIGGLFNSSDSDTDSKFPFLSKLPLAGNLFKTSKEIQDQTELVIAITPKIVNEDFEESIPIPGGSQMKSTLN